MKKIKSKPATPSKAVLELRILDASEAVSVVGGAEAGSAA